MKFKIAICDDESIYIEQFKHYIECYYMAYDNIDFEVFAFNTGTDLLNEHKVQSFDIIFLDIELQNENGIDIAKSLKNISTAYVHIPYLIFVTSYPKYMQNCFDVQPFNFVQKPVEYSRFQKLINSIIEHYTNSASAKIALNTSSERHKIPVNEVILIRYLQERKNYAEYVLTTQTITAKANMQQLETDYKDYGLISPHKGYLININHARSIKDNKIIMDNNTIIEISRRNIQAIQKAFAKSILSDLT